MNSQTVIRQVTAPHGDMRYFRFGNENGAPFVILPGLSLKSVMGAAEAVAGAYAILAEQYDIYLFDRITEFPEGYDINQMAEDTLAAFDVLNLNHVIVMGVSQGGMIAQTIAVNEPDRISRLILCSTAPSFKTADPHVFTSWRELAVKKDARGLFEAFGSSVYSPDFYAAYKDAILAQAEGVTDFDYRNFIISIDGTRTFDLTDRLSSITCPVYVLGAGKDQVLGAEGSRDLMKLLNCAGYMYEDKGHGVYDEAPDYLTHVRDFLAQ